MPCVCACVLVCGEDDFHRVNQCVVVVTVCVCVWCVCVCGGDDFHRVNQCVVVTVCVCVGR